MPEEDLQGWKAARAWGRLGSNRQREVLKLAKQGKVHPDPDVAKVSLAWAHWILSQHAIWLTLGSVGLIVLVIVGSILLWHLDITPFEVVIGAIVIVGTTLLFQRRRGRLIQNAGQRTSQ